jgi:molecular chaperone DnaK (HSP70)
LTDENNKAILPSVVHCGKDNKLTVGCDACPYAKTDPTNTIPIKSPPNDFSARSLSEVRIVAEISTADKFPIAVWNCTLRHIMSS